MRKRPFIVLIFALMLFMAVGITYNAYAVVKPKVKRISVESPVNNKTYKDKDIIVKGFALDPSGVKDVKVYADGKLMGTASYGIKRTDINKKYPGYPSKNNSGFSFTINYWKLEQGKHSITAKLTGKDNKTLKTTVLINLVRSPLKNINKIETPASGATVTDNDKIELEGYFLSEKKIEKAEVYFDDKLVGKAETGMEREDITGKYPQYGTSIKPGYSYTIDTLNVDKGQHEIKIVITTSDNNTSTTSRSFYYSGQAPKFKIESPETNLSTDNYNVTLSGYFISTSPTKEIDVYLDGIFWAFADQNIDRQDMAAKYPEYSSSAKCGFQYVMDMSPQKTGKHTITVEAYNEDGKKYSNSIDVIYNKPSPKLVVSSPKANTSVNTAQLTVSGWSVGASGISSVAVYLDDEAKGNAATGIATTATSDILKQYKGAANAGYSLQLDITSLPIGKHTLEVRSMDLDGITTVQKLTFNMNGAVEYMSYENTFDSYVDTQFSKNKNYVGNSTKQATRDQLSAAMDPSNFVDDPQGKFMFLKLNYVPGIKASDLDAALQGMGVLSGKGSVFIEAGEKYNINPIYLAAHAMHETGQGTSLLAMGVEVSSVGGKPVDTKTVYNMYGIGATDGNVVKGGSEKAYNEGWFSVDDAIIGGAKFIANGYINSDTYKQYTLYRMRWNFTVTWHEYATDINWAYSQTKYIKAIVDKMTSPILVFEVPKFSE